jgi:hypothetical protein
MLVEKFHAISGASDVAEDAFTEDFYESGADALLDVVGDGDSDDGSSVAVRS